MFIEKNATVEKLDEFKVNFIAFLQKLYELVARLVPMLSMKDLDEFISVQIRYLNGIYPSINLSDTQQEAIKLAGNDYLTQELQREYKRFTILIYNVLTS